MNQNNPAEESRNNFNFEIRDWLNYFETIIIAKQSNYPVYVSISIGIAAIIIALIIGITSYYASTENVSISVGVISIILVAIILISIYYALNAKLSKELKRTNEECKVIFNLIEDIAYGTLSDKKTIEETWLVIKEQYPKILTPVLAPANGKDLL